MLCAVCCVLPFVSLKCTYTNTNVGLMEHLDECQETDDTLGVCVGGGWLEVGWSLFTVTCVCFFFFF